MKSVHAIYEDGVFKPTGPVDLPEHSEVQFEPVPVKPRASYSSGVELSRYAGVVKVLEIDPLEYQRRIREEWV